MSRYLLLAIGLALPLAACATGSATPDEPDTSSSEAPEPPENECDMWDVSEAVGRATPAFQNCYNRAVEQNPDLADQGTIEMLLQWYVRADGTTEHPSIVRTDADAPAVHQCLKQQAEALHLPDLSDETCLARHGFRFSPGDNS